jgi:hypothetical protein
MKFKGTNLEWEYRPQAISKNGFYIETRHKNHIGTFIAEVGGGLQDLKEIEANALLISKAPQILEMLKELIEQFDYIEDMDSIQQTVLLNAKQLIRKATEL